MQRLLLAVTKWFALATTMILALIAAILPLLGYGGQLQGYAVAGIAIIFGLGALVFLILARKSMLECAVTALFLAVAGLLFSINEAVFVGKSNDATDSMAKVTALEKEAKLDQEKAETAKQSAAEFLKKADESEARAKEILQKAKEAQVLADEAPEKDARILEQIKAEHVKLVMERELFASHKLEELAKLADQWKEIEAAKKAVADLAKQAEMRPTTWKSLASMPTARSLLATVTGLDGRIYAIGGQNASGRLDIVEVYDPITNTWTKAAPMPTARIHLAATMGPDNLIYAIGGVSSNPKMVEAYNPSTNKWITVAPMPTARHGLAAVTGPDGRIYAIGGNGPGGSLNTVEAYDTKTNTWTTVASMPTARNALATATGPDGRIYAIGGHPVGDVLNPAEAYDPTANKWTTVASMPTVRGELAAATGRDGRIYAIGGSHDGKSLNTVEALSFSPTK